MHTSVYAHIVHAVEAESSDKESALLCSAEASGWDEAISR